ncbi:MAG TPA: hypothetical protein VMN36_02470 [Verrucomicrobiales bacterium]|nr:hypothetical protein [Verrucomicrobiales bacterium]
MLKDAEGKETGSVIIDGLDAAQVRAMQTGEWNDGFDWTRPGILRRLGGPEPAQ